MKKLSLIPLLLIAWACYAQDDCDNFKAIAASYIFPKTMAAGIDYYSETGLTAGASASYSRSKKNKKEQGDYKKVATFIDIFVGAGYRIIQKDYKFSLFATAGITMGNENPANLYFSTRALFPINNKAISIEPLYIINRGLTAKVSLSFKL